MGIKDLNQKDKDIIERDNIIRNFHEFMEDLKYDLEQMVKKIKEYLE